MSYQEQTSTLVDEVQSQVAAALAAYLAGTITAEAFVAVVAAFVAAGNAGAAALGDLSLAAAVTIATGSPAAPQGIVRPSSDPERLERAAETILSDLTPDAVALDHAHMRFQRLIQSEVRKAVADAYAEAVEKNENVVGWTRGLEPEACQLCRWWWREGRVWAPDHPFQTHKGCDCSQIIVTRKEDAA